MKTATVKKEVQQPLINMKYGAPELISLYQRYAFRGLMFALVFASFVIGGVIAYNSLHATANDEKEYDRKIIDVKEFVMPTTVTPEIPQEAPEVPKGIESVKLKDLGALIPQPVAKQESEVLTTKTQDKLNENNLPVSHEGTEDPGQVTWNDPGKIDNGKIEKEIIKEEPVKVENKNFQSFEVEKSPVAVNLNSVKSSLKYPEIARASNVEGTCVAKILVGTSGEIIKVASISGPNIFHSEIEDKIMDLQFTPALQNGQAVRCYVNVPFKFTLGTKKSTDE